MTATTILLRASEYPWLATVRGFVFAVTLGAAGAACSQSPALAAPNVVVISPHLVTSGQPTPVALGELKARGFAADIYLAPSTVSDAVRNERQIVTRQGVAFFQIPVDFDHPTEADFDRFAAILSSLGNQKTLVHCQVNLRASSFVFLYRAIVLKEDPHVAYDAVSKVWAPEGPWRRLMEEELRRHQVAFDFL